MKKLWLYILALATVLSACTRPEVEEPSPQPEPGTETQEETPEGKPRYVWIDASANFYYFANNKAYIAKELAQIADCGFTDIIVDVRPTEGTVLFKSKIAPAAKRLAAWLDSGYSFVYREATWDYLQAFIDAGHAAGLKVHAAINTFVCGYGGYYGLESEGPIFTGEIPSSWACMDWNGESIVSSFTPGVQGTVFMNPASSAVQEYVLGLLDELAHYDIDGIVLDRCRYSDAGLMSEFSDESKAKFSEYIGKEPTVWPVMKTDASTLPFAIADEQKAWLSFRAKTIHDFIQKAASTVHGVNPDIKFGVYVGAWYSTYYTSGVNWASPRYLTHTKYSKWADKDYHNYGFADHCDYMFLGCYASTSSIYGSGEWTMEGFAKQGASLLLGDTVFSGGPDIGNPEGWTSGRRSAYIPKTFDAITKYADGYFVFDLCHIRMFEYWSAFKTTFNDYINSLTK